MRRPRRSVLRLLSLAALFWPVCHATQGFAQDDEARFEFGGDLYAAGEAPVLRGEAAGSLFAAGERVRSEVELDGSAHLAGRAVGVAAPVGGNVYAAGWSVEIEAPVAGDVSAAAYMVEVDAEVAGTLRAAASEVEIRAPVGAALLAAERVRLDAEIRGDARIMAEEVDWGPDARIGGRLTLAEDAAAPPPSVIPPERVERFAGEPWERAGPGPVAVVIGAVLGVLGTIGAVVLVQALFLGAVPGWTEALAFDLAERPFRSLGAGFLAASALAGSIPVLAITLVGAPLIVVSILAIPLAGLAGVALGAWGIGAALWRLANRPAPEGFWLRLLIGVIGLLALGLLSLIPIAGWVILVAVTLAGLGAACARIIGRA